MRRIGFLILVMVAVALRSSAVGAQAADKAQAEALFDQGRQLLSAGQYAEACKKFEASQTLDAGVGTLLNLAACYEKLGRTASAWITFLDAASMAKAQGQVEREELARQQAAALQPKIPKLTIHVDDSNLVPGFELLHNGRVIPEGSWGSPLPVDPGSQELEARAPGKQPWRTTVEVREGAMSTDVQIPKLQDASERAAGPSLESSETTRLPDADRSGAGQRTWGFVVGGAGVVGLAVGAIFGVRALSKNNESLDNCRTTTFCTATGKELRETAQSAATISTIAFGAGAALAATGLVLVLSAPSDEHAKGTEKLRVAAAVAPGGLSLTLGGQW